MGRRALEKKFEVQGDCIICVSHRPNQDGYIRIWVGSNNIPPQEMLHRTMWKQVHGEIPDGYEVDHICRERKCCNVKHLQLLTISEHKTKTNLERYADRTRLIKLAIEAGEIVKDIAHKYGVTTHTITRYKRIMNGAQR